VLRRLAPLLALALAPCSCERAADPARTLDQYVEADEVASQHHGTVVRIHGYVAPGTTMQGPGGTYRFRVVRRRGGVEVTYGELLPERFQDKLEVIVTGKLAADGASLEATELVTKCPSDYEALPQWTSDAAP
jgi:cytochrome c-type biogenesis protein CcmE